VRLLSVLTQSDQQLVRTDGTARTARVLADFPRPRPSPQVLGNTHEAPLLSRLLSVLTSSWSHGWGSLWLPVRSDLTDREHLRCRKRPKCA
jgi:hypothetical protein